MTDNFIKIVPARDRNDASDPPQDLVRFCQKLEAAFPQYSPRTGDLETSVALLHSVFISKRNVVREGAYNLLLGWNPVEPGHRIHPENKQWLSADYGNVYKVKMTDTGATHYIGVNLEAPPIPS